MSNDIKNKFWKSKSKLLVGSVFLGAVIFAQPAFAVGDSNSIQQVFCNVIEIMMGGTGKSIATVGLIGLGVGALFGKVSWNTAMLAIMSIGVIFGAASIVSDLGGGTALSLIVGVPGDGGNGGEGVDGQGGLGGTGGPGQTGGGDTGGDTSTCTGGALAAD